MAVVRNLGLLTGRKAADQPSVVTIDTMAAANDNVSIPSDVETVFLCWQLASQPPLQCIDIRQDAMGGTVCRYYCEPAPDQSSQTFPAYLGAFHTKNFFLIGSPPCPTKKN